jgi:hypothetical protein
MSAKLIAAFAVVCAAGLSIPAPVQAGGEIQEYQTTTRRAAQTTSYAPAYANGYYGPPAVAYARPMGMYYGSYCNTCGPQPYGYSGYAYGNGGGFGVNNDILTAGLLGLGIGYLIFH